MSEYWKSTPKYWCKHCSAYVKDTPFERKQHESTGKHQGNLKRFLRGIQNDHEKAGREKEKVKAEVDRLNRVVGGHTSSSGSPASTSTTSRKTTVSAPTAVDQKRQWQQLAEMGIQVPDNFRGEMALPGQWQSVSQRAETSSSLESTLSVGIRKRKLENDEEDEDVADSVKPRGWGTTTRRYPGETISDLDELLNGTILKKEPTTSKESNTEMDSNLSSSNNKGDLHGTGDTGKQPEAETVDNATTEISVSVAGQATVKVEKPDLDEQNTSAHAPQPPIVAPVFKKRKTKSKTEQEPE